MLKRMLSLIMTIAVMLTVIVISDAPTVMAASTLEFLYGTDFEDGLAGHISNSNSGAHYGFTAESTITHSGSVAARYKKTGEYVYSGIDGFKGDFEVGKSYQITFWAYIVSGTTSSGTYTCRMVPGWSSFSTAKSGIAQGEWTQVVYNYNCTSELAYGGIMGIDFAGADIDYIIDDIEIYEIVPDPSVLYETDFEYGLTGHISTSNGSTSVLTAESTITHSGSVAARYKKSTEYVYSGIEGFKGKFEVGKRYEISFWAYVISGTTSSGTYTCRMVPGWSSFSTAKSGIAQGEWTQIVYNYNCTSALSNGGIMGIDFAGSDIDYVIDDLAIRELPLYETSFEGEITSDSQDVYGDNSQSQSSAKVHSGSYSLKKEKKSEGSYVRLTGFDKVMEQNQAYKFSLWVYVEGGSAETYDFGFIPVSNYRNYRGYLTAKENISTGQWVNIEYDFIFEPVNYGESAPSSMWTMAFDVTGADTVYYLDDIKIEKITPPTAEVVAIYGLETTDSGRDGTGAKGLTVEFSQAVTSESATATTSYTINGSSDLIKSVTNVADNQFYVEFTNVLPEGFYLFGMNGVISAASGEAVPSYTIDFECTDGIGIEVNIYKDYGTEAQYAITDGALMSGKLTASVDVFGNYVNETATPMVTIALYNNNKLMSAKTNSVNVGAYSELEEPLTTAEITVPEFDDETNYTVKAFLWDATNGAPYIQEITLAEP